MAMLTVQGFHLSYMIYDISIYVGDIPTVSTSNTVINMQTRLFASIFYAEKNTLNKLNTIENNS